MMEPIDRAFNSLATLPPGSDANMLLAVGTATVMGMILAVSYRLAWGQAYDRDIAASQVMLAALMAMVMLAVGDSLGRAFGSVGILSVLRFRIKMRRTGDALALLSAVITGMAAGVGLYHLAIEGGFILALLAVILTRFVTNPNLPNASEVTSE